MCGPRIACRSPAAEHGVRMPMDQMADDQLLRLREQQRMRVPVDAAIEVELADQHREVPLQPRISDGEKRINIDGLRAHEVLLGVEVDEILVEIKVQHL